VPFLQTQDNTLIGDGNKYVILAGNKNIITGAGAGSFCEKHSLDGPPVKTTIVIIMCEDGADKNCL
jgi:hypothetical protein